MGMSQAAEAEFRAFATSRRSALRRTAYLLSGDWHQADDLVQATLVKLYVAWRRVRSDSPDAYARRILMRSFLDERRRPWRRETLVDFGRDAAVDLVDDRAAGATPSVEGLDLRSALAALPARQRATLVLRFWIDATVAETAAALDCSEGTVKSQTARGIGQLRRLLADPALITEESS